MAATTGHSINTGPYRENTETYSSLKLLHWLNLNCISHWKVLYKLCVFYVDRNSKMTTTAGHSFYIGPIGFFYNQVNDTGSWEPLVTVFKSVQVFTVFKSVQVFTVCLYMYCCLISNYHSGLDPINRCNPATFVCLSQIMTWSSKSLCRVLSICIIQEVNSVTEQKLSRSVFAH
jgi:hypothetical protein